MWAQRQPPKPVLDAALGPVACPNRSARSLEIDLI